jgi:dihydroorotase
MGASTGSLLVHRTEDLEKIFSQGRRLIAVHAEDELTIQANKEKIKGSTDVRDHNLVRTPEAALKATQLAVSLAKKYQRRLHILHLTSQEEVEFLAKEKIPGLISVEVCPQHFLMHAPDIYDRLGTYGQMNPPIREKRHGEALWNALRTGIIDCIATDHAPHTIEEKEKGFPNSPSGMPGVETSLPLMLNQVNLGLCTLQEVVRWMCEKPVELYGVVNKGYITAGYDADLVLVDMNRKKMIENGKLQTKVNWSPYHGLTTQGWPIMTFVNGHMVYGEGQFFTEKKGRELQFNPIWEKNISLH